MEATLGRTLRNAEELAALLGPEIPDDATVEWADWGKQRVIACMSGGEGGLTLYVFGEVIETFRIGRLPGGIVKDTRRVMGDPMRERMLHTVTLGIEHPKRLEQPLQFDIASTQEDRVAQIRNALVALTRS